MKAFYVSAAVTIVALIVIMTNVGSCYPMPPVNPPSCAQDPTQPWCVPPPFDEASRAHDAGCWQIGVEITDAGVKVDGGSWRYPSRVIAKPCKENPR